MPAAPHDAFAGLLPTAPPSVRDFGPTDQVTVFARVAQGGKDALLPASVRTRIEDAQGATVFDHTDTLAVSQFAGRVVDVTRRSIEETAAAVMKANQAEISHMVARADQLGNSLRKRPVDLVLCHSDLHAGNLLMPQSVLIFMKSNHGGYDASVVYGRLSYRF